MNNEKLDPQKYFDYIKDKKSTMTPEFLNTFESVVDKELKKAVAIGQDFMVKRLAFTMAMIGKERELLKEDINVYVLKEDITDYIKNVSDKAVKIVELEFYPRTIPDEVAEKVAALKEKNAFDRYYVVFTDYTGEAQKSVAKENMRRDPILFGTFEKKIDEIWDIHDRFYFIGDWEDEYCDLTLTKMVDEMSKRGKDIVKVSEFEDITEEKVRAYLNNLQELEANRFTIKPRKQSFFKKVRVAVKSLFS